MRIIESLVEHVPEHIKVELDSLRGLLKSPLFYQYLDYHDLQKISELTDSVGDSVWCSGRSYMIQSIVLIAHHDFIGYNKI